ncbi:MAG: OmpA family protein [Deltaproteobacteria bacterium]|nr:OmpA family protein [Deltaproteobacteria bacterium]
MRSNFSVILLLAGAVLLTGGGCSNQKAVPGKTAAPSELAAAKTGLDGWSASPGQAGPGKTRAGYDDLSEPAGGVQGRNSTGRPSSGGEGVSRPPMTETTGMTKGRSRNSPPPIVPAFPVRMTRERLVDLERVHFGFDRWDITPRMAQVLDANARWLLQHPGMMVRIEGHTDEQGTSEYNLSLGERRAVSVRIYLINRGVSADSLLTMSYGEEAPLDSGAGEGSFSKNRRVEFSLIERPGLTRASAAPATPRM